MNRKQFVWLGLGGLATVAVPTAWFYLRDLKYDARLAQPLTLSLIWDDKSIVDIGNKYRQQSGENKERTLVRKLLANAENDKAAINALDKTISNDFASGKTVQIDGWILSLTEARQCALFAITHAAKK
jgi:hypothetical protein